MDYQSLLDRIPNQNIKEHLEMKRIVLLATRGTCVCPEFSSHLADSSSPTEFLDAIYADDELRFTKVWAEWAKYSGKDWTGRFTPVQEARALAIERIGLPLCFSEGCLYISSGISALFVDLLVFDDEAFNENAATFVSSVEGSFICGGLTFKGFYGIFASRGTIILEKWCKSPYGTRIVSLERPAPGPCTHCR